MAREVAVGGGGEEEEEEALARRRRLCSDEEEEEAAKGGSAAGRRCAGAGFAEAAAEDVAHSRAVPSCEADRTCPLAASTASALTGAVCPCSVRAGVSVPCGPTAASANVHTRTAASQPAETSRLGERKRAVRREGTVRPSLAAALEAEAATSCPEVPQTRRMPS